MLFADVDVPRCGVGAVFHVLTVVGRVNEDECKGVDILGGRGGD